MKKTIYKSLEEQMITYKQLIQVKTKENNEPFITLAQVNIPSGYKKETTDGKKCFNGQIAVRETVAKKLLQVQNQLQNYDKNLSIYVTYGYRSLEVQTQKFLTQLKKTSQRFFPNEIDLYEEVHRFIAVPTVAGHPTGGAIDIVIIYRNTGEMINFGSPQYEFTKNNCYTFYPNISKTAKKHRMLLRRLLMQAGFAPFDGEWWHFSYGDREWAYYYKKEVAIYAQKNYKQIKNIV